MAKDKLVDDFLDPLGSAEEDLTDRIHGDHRDSYTRSSQDTRPIFREGTLGTLGGGSKANRKTSV